MSWKPFQGKRGYCTIRASSTKAEGRLTALNALKDLMNEAKEKNEDYNFSQFNLIIVNHLKITCHSNSRSISLQTKIQGKIFLWILDPFNFTSQTNTLSMNKKEMLADLSSDIMLKNLKNNSSLEKFLTKVHSKYNLLSEKALRVLLPFPSTYLCESGFSAVTAIKTKYQNRLTVTPTLKLSLSNLIPNMDEICHHMQAHPSH
nr:protein FAM200A-like [Pelodiscus sinensis]|eukprot:XP_025039763.1 protein FAM200A-like [Pelodiscus sinensis]